MTPEERAERLVITKGAQWGGLGTGTEPLLTDDAIVRVVACIAACIREAVEAERDECAKACEERSTDPKNFDFDDDEARGAYHCEGAIRARGNHTP